MIFPNPNGTNAVSMSQLLNPGALPLSLAAYSGVQVNVRDSSWLKLTVCELYLKSECPNVDNCSLAHPPGTVKIENNTVTVCYDYIKKKDCKHGNCKYYHPHDALASSILRRGDDSKKNGMLNNLGLSLGLRNYPVNRSQDFYNFQAPNFLSSPINNPQMMTNDPQMKAKLEIGGEAKKIKQEPGSCSNGGGILSAVNTTSVATPSTTLPMLPYCGLPTQAFPVAQPQQTAFNNYFMYQLAAAAAASQQQQQQQQMENLLATQKLYQQHQPPPAAAFAYPGSPLFPQIYYQQLLQPPLPSAAAAPSPGLIYPNLNLVELQQRSIEETSVAFINDKGAILETLPVCKDFLSGKCKRNQSCNYVHLTDSNVEVKDCKLTVCKNALKGQCHRPVCKFYHIPAYQLQKLGVSPLH